MGNNTSGMNGEAVSPVVGVMLMLVVTIIIAAVVSAFAGGIAGEEIKTPQASIVAKEIAINEAYDDDTNNWAPDPIAGKCSDVYVVFEHVGGDPLNLNNIAIYLGSMKYQHEKSVISNAMTSSTDTALTGFKTDIASAFSNDWATYIEGYPDHATVIATGDRFVLHADFVNSMMNVSSHHITRQNLGWQNDDAGTAFKVENGDYLTYEIMDKESQKVICSGQIVVPEFAVVSS
jgi:FlaG/FlaF family flagellin (archaellin)